MKTWKKVLIGLGVALVLVIIVSITVYQSHKKPRYRANGQSPEAEPRFGGKRLGRGQAQDVREHRRECVRQDRKTSRQGRRPGQEGQLLAQLENVQSSADVNAMRASLQAAETDAVAADAANQDRDSGFEPRQVRRSSRQA